MPDPTGSSYVAAFGLALKGLQAMQSMSKKADLDRQASELFDIILAGQRSALEESVKQRALLETVRDLETKLARAEGWAAEKQRYAMVSIRGSVAYALKKESAGSEPPHWICTACYENGRKSILNAVKHPTTKEFDLACPVCKSHVATSSWRSPRPTYAGEPVEE